jgi:pimeloyl-ACP methyl ester carboxylesterase
VFESGFGGTHESWDDVAPRVSASTSTFVYDRPGRGESEPTPHDSDGVRTSEEAARALHAALRASDTPRPYVLVGWSLGGLYVQKFAQLFPADVAAVVLLDNRPATYMAECRAAGMAMCAHEDDPDPSWSAASQATMRGITPSEAVAPSPEQLGDIPVLVITAGATVIEGNADFTAGFREAQRRFAGRVRNGRQVLIEAATHDDIGHVHAERVANEILGVVETARRSGAQR